MMDTRTVTGLAGKALESVLGFRVNAFAPRSFIDIKSIKAATSGAIRTIIKQRGYSSEVPLINVGEVVGDAVVSAAKEWNKVADAKNHIDANWLRNCVCDLVGGTVTHAALEKNKWLNAEIDELEYEGGEQEYLDPARDDSEGFSDNTINTINTINTVVHNPAAAALAMEDDGFYGLQQTNGTDHDGIVEDDAAPLPRHQIEHGWTTVKDSIDAADSHHLNFDSLRPSHKRAAPSTDTEDNDESETQIIQPKRRRNANRDPVTPVAKVVPETEEDENHDGDQEDVIDEDSEQRKVSIRIPWTSAESTRLVNARDSGKGWDEVHELFSNRTKSSLMNKYRTLKDGERSAPRKAAVEEHVVARGSGSKKRGGLSASGGGFRL